ncbi:MAG: hypothetical protein JXA17_03180 [Dehalococcoidales bacterium]|nr:hypothetical protein [Dehalococcoidales bacterium]
MAKRIKKPPVKPEKRLEWLKRVEKEGETLTHIAESDDFDLRTVRKHIEIARLERDVQKARSEVLRNALEGHYRDLLDAVRNIEKQIASQSPASLEKDTPLMYGLRQHMPRSPIWENLRKWNRTLTEIVEIEDAIGKKIKREIEADGRLKDIVSYGAKGVIPAAVDVLTHQVKAWAYGSEGLKIDRDMNSKKRDDDKVSLNYGFSHFGEIETSHVDIIKAVIGDFESKLKDEQELLELEKAFNRLGRLKASIHETVTTILLRRIVPGRCKYCPL